MRANVPSELITIPDGDLKPAVLLLPSTSLDLADRTRVVTTPVANVLGSVVTSTNNSIAVDIESQNDQVTFKNTIVAFNAPNNCQGTITSLGYNIDSGTTLGFAATGDLSNTDPRLGPLQNNGGATLTMMPETGSVAVGRIPPANCPPTDQRGVARPQGPRCDIGSVETGFSRWETYLPQAARNGSGW